MRPRSLRSLLPALAALFVVSALVGCGGGDSGSDPAAVAPAGAPVFIGVDLRLGAQAREDIDALGAAIAGVDDVGGRIVAELEAAARGSGQRFDYARDMEPWLGERAGLALLDFDGEDFHGYVGAVQTEDEEAAEEFLDKFFADPGERPRRTSHEGVEYLVDSDGDAAGVVDGLVVVAAEDDFKRAVEAASGDALADADAYEDAVEAAPQGSLADAFIDIGALLRSSGDRIDAETEAFLDSSGIEPREATALASLVPGSGLIEVVLSTDVTESAPTDGDASRLLGSLPGDSFAAIASDGFGKRLRAAIDKLDKRGIPDTIPPGELKSGLKQAGIDLDSVSSKAGDLAVFATGRDRRTLGGGVVVETGDGQAVKNMVSNIGLLLRSGGAAGVREIDTGFSGFVIRGAGIDGGPLVVGANEKRVAVATGVKVAAAALAGGDGPGTLAAQPGFKRAVAALGDTPITGWADGPAALRLASNLIPAGDAGFRRARPFLRKVSFLALGGGESEDRSTAKLIVGVRE